MSCITLEDLQEFCDRVRIAPRNTVSETVKSIACKVKKTPSCIRKNKLQRLAQMLNINDQGTMKEIAIRINNWIPEEYKRPPPRSFISENKESQIVKNSIRKNVVKKNTGPCMMYKGNYTRYLTIIPVPNKELNMNKKGQWLPEGRYMRWNICKNVAYYLSTGTSNAGKNFPGIWFPFMRVQERSGGKMPRGWLDKSYGLEGTTSKYGCLNKLSTQLGVKITPFLLVFFEKFSYWWQVSISAALPTAPEALWNTHPELIALKPLALSYIYDKYDGFRKGKVVDTYYVPKPCFNEGITPEDINRWLLNNNALCYDQDSY